MIAGIIFPHEQTRGPWVEDRVRMMEATRSALSPLLVVFQDDIRHSVGGIIRAVTGGPPLEGCDDVGRLLVAVVAAERSGDVGGFCVD